MVELDLERAQSHQVGDYVISILHTRLVQGASDCEDVLLSVVLMDSFQVIPHLLDSGCLGHMDKLCCGEVIRDEDAHNTLGSVPLLALFYLLNINYCCGLFTDYISARAHYSRLHSTLVSSVACQTTEGEYLLLTIPTTY